MTITTILGINFVELKDSRETTKSVDQRTVPLRYLAWHTHNQETLNTAFDALVGTSFTGIPLSSTHCTPQGGGVWQCEAVFSFKAPSDAANTDEGESLGPAYAVDLSAGQVHITQSLETIAKLSGGSDLRVHASTNNKVYPGTGVSEDDVGAVLTILDSHGFWTAGNYTITAVDTAAGTWTLSGSPGALGSTGGLWKAASGPNYRQAIGVSKDGVAGTDVFSPKFEFSKTVKTSDVTLDFLRTLAAACATTNAAEFEGFEASTVLYLGCTGQYQDSDLWTFTHKFAVGRNRTGLVVTPHITLDKKAWEYLWCAYGKREVAGLALMVPQTAYVEKVYEESDFNLLRLNPPVANFTGNPIGGLHPLAVQFADTSTGTPLTWAWTFGDGTTSSVQHPSKTYLLPGVYTVSLTVENGAGASSKTTINYITVS